MFRVSINFLWIWSPRAAAVPTEQEVQKNLLGLKSQLIVKVFAALGS